MPPDIGSDPETPRRGNLPQAQLSLVLERIQKISDAEKYQSKEQRASPRFHVGGVAADCTVEHPGGGRAESIIHMVDISENGCQFIYEGYLHRGTMITVMMRNNRGQRTPIAGVVARCEHVIGRSHTVGIVSCDPCPVRDLVPQEVWLTINSEFKAHRPIAGSIVNFSESEIDSHVVGLHLHETNAKVQFAQTPGKLFDILRMDPIDLAMLDVDLEAMAPDEIVNGCRKQLYRGPILIVSNDPEAAYVTSMDPDQNCQFLPKPLDRDLLHCVIREMMDTDTSQANAAAITSTIMTATNQALIDEYIKDARELTREILDLAESENSDRVRHLLLRLSGTGQAFGFAPLSEAAREAIELLAKVESPKHAMSALRRVHSIVQRMDTEPGKIIPAA